MELDGRVEQVVLSSKTAGGEWWRQGMIPRRLELDGVGKMANGWPRRLHESEAVTVVEDVNVREQQSEEFIDPRRRSVERR